MRVLGLHFFRCLVITAPFAGTIPAACAHDVAAIDESGQQRAASRVPAGFKFELPFVKPDAVDLKNAFPDWPRDGTLAGQADLDTVFAAQLSRSANDIAAARRDANLGAMEWAGELMGNDFNAGRLPVTAALLARIDADFEPYSNRSPYELRGRPKIRDSRIVPVIAYRLFSYPSARAAATTLWANVLADALLSRREALQMHAIRSGWLQVISGAHFPTDLAAGRLLSEAFLMELRKSAAYRSALIQVREELFGLGF